ncbi:cobalamin-dependent protein [Streptomyces kunmingensis]|uniref:Cobalamin-dependent protein n=1 Tax=Streptomyces kunmingensis TaxID=68225 RepID=A0ABU6CNB9_9ACTN|nr:cobalamin-dependent protein [Streptomyces kunmingensis]MEB3966223.1 cobalamin-dependent protein [Streptomyces kunmingensis]
MNGGNDTNPMAELSDQLWQALGECDETRAVAVVRRALDTAEPGSAPAGGTSAAEGTRAAGERVLLELIGPAQERVGLAWAANEITVGQEHAATAISERCIAAVAAAAATATSGPFVGRVLVACVDGEWHALPARLVSEVLRLRGWRVDYLGAHVPTEHLVAHARHTGAQAVLLSSSIPTLLPGAHNAITACQGIGVPVIAGGAAFGPQGRYARLMRAEWAEDASGAATVLGRNLTAAGAPAARPPDLDLPHLGDQEYTMIRRSRLQLTKQTLADVEMGFPEMGGYSEFQLDRTVEDIEFIVSYLATAVYVDDPPLFHRFVTWTAGILAARDVPPRCLLPALDSLLSQLKDFPRVVGILTAAHGLVTP